MKRIVHHPDFVQLIHLLKPLLRQYPPLAVMRTDDMVDWMAWYWNRGTMTWWINEMTREPQGVCLIRLFRHLDQFVDPAIHDPCGKFCFIELSVASDPIIMGLMLDNLTKAWGPQEIVMWERGERTENGAPRMYSWKNFMKLAHRLSHGYIEQGVQ